MIRKICFLSCVIFSLHSFQYDNAADMLKQGKWDEAYDLLVPLIVDNPDRADLLYDAGIAAYNKDKYSQALTYFVRSAENSDNNNLKINAYFNAGNACVPLKELHKAIKYYDATLSIDPQNEYAQHNKQCVLEMIKQQEEQEEQKKQDKPKDQDQQKNQNDDQNRQDQQNGGNDQNGNSGQQQDKNQQNQDDGTNSDSGSDQKDSTQNQKDQSNQQSQSNQSEEESNQEERSDSSDGGKSNTRKNKRNKKENATNSDDNQQRNHEDKLQDHSDQNNDESNSQQSKNHDNSLRDQEEQHDSNNSTVTSKKDEEQPAEKKEDKGQAAACQGEEEMAQALKEKLNDPWLMNLLKEQEERDKATNKQLMGAKIRQNGGKNGQNCW